LKPDEGAEALTKSSAVAGSMSAGCRISSPWDQRCMAARAAAQPVRHSTSPAPHPLVRRRHSPCSTPLVRGLHPRHRYGRIGSMAVESGACSTTMAPSMRGSSSDPSIPPPDPSTAAASRRGAVLFRASPGRRLDAGLGAPQDLHRPPTCASLPWAGGDRVAWSRGREARAEGQPGEEVRRI